MAKRRSVFTPDSARRIARAVQQVERTPVQGLRYRTGTTFVPDWYTDVYNGEASQDCPGYGVMLTNGIQSLGSDMADYVPKLKRPDTYGCQWNAFIAGPDGIDHQSRGAAQMADHGQYVALYDDADGTPASGEMWGPRASTFKLKKNTGGFQVLGVVNSTRKLVLVRTAPFLQFRGVTNGAISSDARGTVSIYYRNSSTSAPFWTDTTVDTPTNSVVNGLDGDIDSGASVECVYDPLSDGTEQWKITQADCPA